MFKQIKQLLSLIAEIQILILIHHAGVDGKLGEYSPVINSLRDRLLKIGAA